MIRGIIRVAAITAVAVFLAGSAYVVGYLTGPKVFPPPAATPAESSIPADWTEAFKVFGEAWNFVHQDFYKTPIDDDALVNGAVGGMVDALGDPHTIFVDAKRAAISRTDLQGSFEGIGATVEMREGRLTVVSPILGSPADKAGILPGDIVLEVNGTAIQGMDVTEAISLIRGPKGSTVKLKIQRAKQPTFEVSIVRDTIKTAFVTSRMIEGTSIGYVRLNEFGATAPDDLQSALQNLMTQKPRALVFDVRSNPGGYLDVARVVTGQFLKKGQTVVIVKDKNGNVTQRLRTDADGLASDIPMVLLVNNGSASASEILSGALRDYKRATIVGVKTYGKGSVQNVNTLSDNSQLNVTIAHFFSPNDVEIDQVGISPDVEVKITDDDVAKKLDPQLDKAIEILKTKIGTTSYMLPAQWTDIATAVQ